MCTSCPIFIDEFPPSRSNGDDVTDYRLQMIAAIPYAIPTQTIKTIAEVTHPAEVDGSHGSMRFFLFSWPVAREGVESSILTGYYVLNPSIIKEYP
jgi:hypothetical protein